MPQTILGRPSFNQLDKEQLLQLYLSNLAFTALYVHIDYQSVKKDLKKVNVRTHKCMLCVSIYIYINAWNEKKNGSFGEPRSLYIYIAWVRS